MGAAIGKIVAHLEATRQLENTFVLFLADNGGSGNGGNAPLKGSKSTLWEGGLRVPCIACWPDKIPGGRVSDEFLTTLELLPTLAAAAEAELPAKVVVDGFSALSVLAGEAPSPRKEMYWEFRGEKAGRIGTLKWIDSEKARGLFDLAVDPGEQHDLSAERPEVVAKFKERWSVWHREMEAAEPRGPFRDY
jgi:arylsulfatase A-like enzyme